MQHLPMIHPGQPSKDHETNSGSLAPSSNDTSLVVTSPQMKAAARWVDRMLDFLPALDVGNPEVWIAAAIEEFAKYPEEVMAATAREIPRRTDRPTQKAIAALLAEYFEPYERQIERERANRSFLRALPPPRVERTEDDQKRIDEKVRDARVRLGIPPEGLARRQPVLPPSADAPYYAPVHVGRGDGKHAERVRVQLEASRARRETSSDVCGNE